MFWLLVAGVSVLLWYILIRPLNYWGRMGIKQTRPWIILGDSWAPLFGLKSFTEYLGCIYNMYPKARYVGFYQFSKPNLMIRDPEIIKQIGIKDFDHFTDHRVLVDPKNDKLFGRNLFSLKGNNWRDMRATLSGSFTSSKMKFLFNAIAEASENFVKFFEKEQEGEVIELEMKDTFTRFTNDVIATTAFGIHVDSLKEPNNRFYLMGKEVTNLGAFKTRTKLLGFMFIPKLLNMLKMTLLNKETADYFTNTIADTIKTREEQGIVRPDMLNILLDVKKGIKQEDRTFVDTGFATAVDTELIGAKTKHRLQLTDADITAQAMIFFFAGFDTISTAMCFTSYELARNLDIQQKLREEIEKTMEKCSGKVTYETLLSMKYMDMVVSESLRLWPPAAGIDRVCTKEYTIEPASPEEKPIHLNKGTIVFFPIMGIHRDPNYYPNPEVFDPERFSDENKDKIKPYSYLPFGVGPRNCIGSRFALLELKCVLFHLLHKFEIVPIKKTQIPAKISKASLNTSMEGGFWLGLKHIET